MQEITAAIVAHARKKYLLNMIWQLENQITPFDEIKLYVSGYEDGELKELEKRYRVSYQPDKKDWGHDKRALAIKESNTRYILCASDDDVYTYHFTEAIQMSMKKEPEAQIYATDWRTQREFTGEAYGYHHAEPKLGGISSGCMVVDSKFINEKVGYNHRDFGADGKLCEDIIKKGGRFIRVPFTCFFHY